MSKIIIIDGHYFLWRSFSVPFKFYSEKGTPLHATTMYLKLIRRSIESIRGFAQDKDSLVIVFDTDTSNDNFELSSDYKANRKRFESGEESPYMHIPFVQKALDLLKIKYLEIPNVEADDTVASIATTFCGSLTRNRAFIVS